MASITERLERAHASVAPRAGEAIEIAVILGTGLGGVAEAVEGATIIPYGEIDAFPVSTAPGHAGRLVLGRLGGRRVGVMQGRFHFFEGWQGEDIALPVYLLRRLGAHTLVVTNAAGGLNPGFTPGDVMLIVDHMNFIGRNPLVGANDEAIGPRFPDMSDAYDRALLPTARRVAAAAGIGLREGVYAAWLGPSLETSAERRFLRLAGGDAVGMSTVPEVIAAKHCGMRVAGFSVITNVATGGPEQQPDTLEDIIKVAGEGGRKLARLLPRLIGEL